MSEVSICNRALMAIGAEPIAEGVDDLDDVTENSEVARLCKAFYKDTNARLQYEHQWRFCDTRMFLQYSSASNTGQFGKSWGGDYAYTIPSEDEAIGSGSVSTTPRWYRWMNTGHLEWYHSFDGTRIFNMGCGFRDFPGRNNGGALLSLGGVATVRVQAQDGQLFVRDRLTGLEDATGIFLDTAAFNFIGIIIDLNLGTYQIIANLDFDTLFAGTLTALPVVNPSAVFRVCEDTGSPGNSGYDGYVYGVSYQYLSGPLGDRIIFDSALNDGRFLDTVRATVDVSLVDSNPGSEQINSNTVSMEIKNKGDGYYKLLPAPEILRIWGVYSDVNQDVIQGAPLDESLWRRENGLIRASIKTDGLYAIGSYRVDDTNLFPNGYRSALEARLSAELALPITQSEKLQAQMYALYEQKLRDALAMDGAEGRNEIITNSRLSNSRSGFTGGRYN